jgi:hypothetical protein
MGRRPDCFGGPALVREHYQQSSARPCCIRWAPSRHLGPADTRTPGLVRTACSSREVHDVLSALAHHRAAGIDGRQTERGPGQGVPVQRTHTVG